MTEGGVRILVVGDANSGKSTFIYACISQEFSIKVPIKMRTATIPLANEGHSYFKEASLIDTSKCTKTDVLSLSKMVDVVVWFIDSSNATTTTTTTDNVDSDSDTTEEWIDIIKQMNVPVVAVMSKYQKETTTSISTYVLDELLSSHYITSYLFLSCEDQQSVDSVIRHAVHAVEYPFAVLYNREICQLKPKFICALTRIYRFTKKFNLNLTWNDFKTYSNCIEHSKWIKASNEAINKLDLNNNNKNDNDDNIFDYDDFIQLHKYILLNYQTDLLWSILRAFGYNNHLEIQDNYLLSFGSTIQKLNKSTISNTYELSDDGILYINMLYNHYCNDTKIGLTFNEIDEIFKSCPNKEQNIFSREKFNLLASSVVFIQHNNILRDAWVSSWSLMTLFDAYNVVKTLAYIGFPGSNPFQCVKQNMPKSRCKDDLSKIRKTIFGMVLGSDDYAKDLIVKSLVGKIYPSTLQNNNVSIYNQTKTAACLMPEPKETIPTKETSEYNNNSNDNNSNDNNGNNVNKEEEKKQFVHQLPSSPPLFLRRNSYINTENNIDIDIDNKHCLILRTIPNCRLDMLLRSFAIRSCDIAILTYDVTKKESIEYIKERVLPHLPKSIPCICVPIWYLDEIHDYKLNEKDMTTYQRQPLTAKEQDIGYNVRYRHVTIPELIDPFTSRVFFNDIMSAACAPSLYRPVKKVSLSKKVVTYAMQAAGTMAAIGIVVATIGYGWKEGKNRYENRNKPLWV